MAINQTDLLDYGRSYRSNVEYAQAIREGTPTAFLSHSHKDAALAKGVQAYLQDRGWMIYIDWEDTAMPDVPSVATAARIRMKIQQLDLFLFLATQNSMQSRWCPWELGFADGKKSNSSILIMQTSDPNGRSYGSEYLELYRHLDETTTKEIGHFRKHGDGHYLRGRSRP